MATFDTVINVDVRLESPPVSRAGFSTSMVVDVHGAGFTERIRRYESATEVNADTDLSTFAKNALLAALSQSPRPSVVAAGRKDAAETWTEAFNAILAADPNWYGFTISSRLQAAQSLAADFAEANKRLFIAQTSDANVIAAAYVPAGVGDIASELRTQAHRMAGVIYHATDSVALDFAWMANRLSVDPDTETTTWAHVTAAGFTPDVALTATAKSNALSKFCNLYLTLAGQGDTGEGRVGDGTFVDLIVTRSWLEARLFEKYATILLRASNRGRKIAYTDQGIQAFIDGTMDILERGVQVGHFRRVAPDDDNPDGYPYARAASVEDTPDADIEDRILRIEAAAIAAGAIHEVDVVAFIVTAEL